MSALITADSMADVSFQQEFLKTHNDYRAKHGTPPLKFNSELTAAAQKWADHLLATGTLQHSNTKDGENVFTMYSSAAIKLTGKEAVDSWYKEIKDFNWSSPGFRGNTGHFTQVVWKDSTELGVGLATDGKRAFVVGQYRPAGNMAMPGYFEKNVLPLGSTTTNTDVSFQQEFLKTHNDYRAKHGTPPLKFNSELTAAAQKWADHLLATGTLQHSNTKDGENVFTMYSSAAIKLTGKEAVDSWYKEIKDYNWSHPGFRANTGHFTQVVWKDSTELGVGLATDDKRAFVVGQYRPAGNMNVLGYFEKNVLPLGSTTTVTNTDVSFQQEFLKTHNDYRAKHGTPPLKFNSELTAAAQKWADHLLATGTLQHSNTKDGENVFTMYSSAAIKLTGKEAVDSWYKEIKDYTWRSPGFRGNTGHFTQVVWKDSTELGVGLATDGKRAFVVGQYRPAGNMVMQGSFEKNVLPLV